MNARQLSEDLATHVRDPKTAAAPVRLVITRTVTDPGEDGGQVVEYIDGVEWQDDVLSILAHREQEPQ